MTVPRVLLLTGTPPGDGSVGKVFLRDLCLAYPHDRLSCFAVMHPDRGDFTADLDWLPRKAVQWRYNKPFRGIPGKLGRLAGLFSAQYTRAVRERAVCTEIEQFARQHNVEMVWAVLNRPVLYRSAAIVSRRLGVPLVAIVWDPPEHIIANNCGLDRFSQRIALKDFDRAMRACVRVAVMSEAMGDEYGREYGCGTVVMHHGVRSALRRPPAAHPQRDRPFTIGFAGSLFAANEMAAVLSALSSVGWRIAERDVAIRLFGSEMRINTTDPVRVEYLGWRPAAEFMTLLSETDVNYLPCSFDSRDAEFNRLSFPTKLSTYLATGRPLFYHGPLDSSPARFLRRYPAGVCCHSLKEDEIIDALTTVARNEELYGRMTAAGQAALEQELSSDVFLRRFAQLIGIDEGELIRGSAL